VEIILKPVVLRHAFNSQPRILISRLLTDLLL
jgi:hypothetical protein